MNDSRTVISLFTGMGGLDYGFEAAGFETRVALELDAAACRVLRANRAWPLIQGDIHSISSEEILRTANLAVGEADVLIGGPPCQPFSKSSYWVTGDSQRLEDPRADTLAAYLRVLRDTRPKTFLLENVEGLSFKGKDDGLQFVVDGIAAINRDIGTNYSISWRVLNAAEYGVPQLRHRIFLVGSRDGAKFQFPAPSHLADSRGAGRPFVTAWDAIGDLTEVVDSSSALTGKWAELIPSIPEGQNYLWHTPRGGGVPLFGWRTRYWSFLLKLAKNLPSWTIQAQPGSSIGPFHWSNRRLTITELCRLQTFPKNIRLDLGRSTAHKLIGNAVPSLLGEVLAREIDRQFLGAEKNWEGFTLGQKVLLPVPGREPVVPVPAKFLELARDYADHPGEGMGAGALRRQMTLYN